MKDDHDGSSPTGGKMPILSLRPSFGRAASGQVTQTGTYFRTSRTQTNVNLRQLEVEHAS